MSRGGLFESHDGSDEAEAEGVIKMDRNQYIVNMRARKVVPRVIFGYSINIMFKFA